MATKKIRLDSELVFPSCVPIEDLIRIAKKLGIKRFYAVDHKVNDAIVDTENGIEIIRVKKTRVQNVYKRDLRSVIESSKDSFIIGIESYFMENKGRLNQVLCALAKDRGHVIVFDFMKLFRDDGKMDWKLLSKIKKAISLFIKYDVKFMISSASGDPLCMRGTKEKESFVRMLQNEKFN